jgi:WhiB family redox-sensing transcriptional regulator
MSQQTIDRGSWLRAARLIAGEIWPTGEDWQETAACRSAEPDLFFPVSASAHNLSQVAAAKAICDRCVARAQCLAYALSTRQVHGIWGGMTEEERYPLLKAGQQRAPGDAHVASS